MSSASSTNSTTTTQPNGSSVSEAHTSANGAPNSSLNADIAALAAALSATPGDNDPEPDGPELAALLAQLERADGVAAGVEARLDALIGGLDAMLAGLGEDDEEALAADTEQPETVKNGATRESKME
jgi:HPt (histidine-containing phosphotransfer) domain-containing protein